MRRPYTGAATLDLGNAPAGANTIDLVVTYLSRAATDWAVNARGQTYGVVNDRGIPDLIAEDATNGRSGYISRKELEAADRGNSTSPEEALRDQAQRAGKTITIPVYEADGTTVIGRFAIG